MSDPATFLRNVTVWVAKAKLATHESVVQGLRGLNAELVAATPVRTGRLRGAWKSAINRTPSGTFGTTANPLPLINSMAARVKPGDTYRVGNVAPYIWRIELGFVGQDALGRSYNQPGQHFVRRVSLRAKWIAENAARRVGRKYR